MKTWSTQTLKDVCYKDSVDFPLPVVAKLSESVFMEVGAMF